jgi:hypothetical protein
VGITKAQKAVVEGKGLKKVADFKASISDSDRATWPAGLSLLQKDVAAFASSFPAVGFNSHAMRYPGGK